MKVNLLHIIDKQDEGLDRGAINEALQELVTEGLVEAKFKSAQPKSIAEHINYKYVLTAKGRETLEAAKSNVGAVNEVKEKKGRPTVIEYKGHTYTLQHPNHVRNAKK